MRLILFAALLSLSTFCYGQETKQLTVAQMNSDFDFLTALLQRAHPSLYRYTPKDTLDKYAGVTRTKFNHPMTDVQFWFFVQHFVAAIRSGHTRVEPDDDFLKQYDQGPHEVLPFHIYIIGNRIFIKDYIGIRDPVIRPNDEILAIDGEGAQKMLNHYRTLVSGDGYNLSLKNYLLENGRFNFLYELAHPRKKVFLLHLRSVSGKDTAVTLQAARTYIPAKPPSALQGGGADQYRLESGLPADTNGKKLFFDQASGAAVLRLPDFSYADYHNFHKALFAQLKVHSATKLFIDLRGNLGGQDFICADLLKYLIGKPFIFSRVEEAKVEVSDFEKGIRDDDLLHIKNGFHTLKYPINDTIHPYPDLFKGRIYLIIDGGTYSSATLFAAALKFQTDCLFIGQESGGNQAGCDGGHIAGVTLPESKLRLFLPLLWTYSASIKADDGQGIIPEIKIPVSAVSLPYRALIDAAP
ncbi:MAG: hypothetical protein JWQ57_290 [Mucilaginibacter sp.]|nr:hypothetical protein [Mucilaginibacter sp.]